MRTHSIHTHTHSSPYPLSTLMSPSEKKFEEILKESGASALAEFLPQSTAITTNVLSPSSLARGITTYNFALHRRITPREIYDYVENQSKYMTNRKKTSVCVRVCVWCVCV